MKMTVDQRYEQGIDHDPKTYKLFKHTRKIDKDNGYVCDFKFGGDGADGEHALNDVVTAETVDQCRTHRADKTEDDEKCRLGGLGFQNEQIFLSKFGLIVHRKTRKPRKKRGHPRWTALFSFSRGDWT